MADTSRRSIGEGLANCLGIEVRAPRPAPPPEPTPAEGAAALCDFVGIAPEHLDATAKRRARTPGAPSSSDQGGGIDRALSIADRVAGGAKLSDEDCTFLWSDPQLIPAFQKRLDLERAIAKGKGG
jgi:hypothetical protein